VSARDADEYPFNQFHYFLLPDSDQSERDFLVDGSSGRLLIARVLDRETRSAYSLLVVARSDKDSRQASTATITVHVTDINDNAPLFVFPSTSNSSVVIYDSLRRGQTVAVVYATDADAAGPNADVSYAIIKDGRIDNLFSIHQKTGVILAKVDVADMLESVAAGAALKLPPERSQRGALLQQQSPPLQQQSPPPNQQRLPAAPQSSSQAPPPLTTNLTFSLTISATDNGVVSLASRASLDIVVMAVRQIDRRSREGRSDTQTAISVGGDAAALVTYARNYKAVLIVCLVTAALSAVLLTAILAITFPRCGMAATAGAAQRKSAPPLTADENPPGPNCASPEIQAEDYLGDSVEGSGSKSSVMLIAATPGERGDHRRPTEKTTRKSLVEVCHVNSRARNKVGYSA